MWKHVFTQARSIASPPPRDTAALNQKADLAGSICWFGSEMMLRSRVEIAPQQRRDGAVGFVLLRTGHPRYGVVRRPVESFPVERRKRARRRATSVSTPTTPPRGIAGKRIRGRRRHRARAGGLSRALADGRSPWNAPPRSPAQGLFQAPAIGPRRAYLPWLGGAVLGIASRTACGPSWGRSVRFSGVAVRASLARSSDISAGQRHA